MYAPAKIQDLFFDSVDGEKKLFDSHASWSPNYTGHSDMETRNTLTALCYSCTWVN